MNSPKKKIKVKCPKCEKDFFYYDSESRPFCSDRCKMIDLGGWMTESYAVPSQSPLELDELEELERQGLEPHELH
jgi:uncharacterized protein